MTSSAGANERLEAAIAQREKARPDVSRTMAIEPGREQSPSTLLVANSAIPSEGNWAGFWGNEAVDQKLHDIGGSGPVVLEPDYSRLKVVGLTRDVAESYVPMHITVSYAGQDGTPRPFLMIINCATLRYAAERLRRAGRLQRAGAGVVSIKVAYTALNMPRASCVVSKRARNSLRAGRGTRLEDIESE